MIITLWGKCGAGKGTLWTKLAEKLWYSIIGIGDMKRDLAMKAGMSILERDQIGRNNPEKAREHDLQFEEYQQSLDPQSNIILDSRLGFYCQPTAFKIFLDVSDEVWAMRVYEHKRIHDANESFEHVLSVNNTRNYGQQEAYKKLYGIDLFDIQHYDLVLDTSQKDPNEVFQICYQAFEQILSSIQNS